MPNANPTDTGNAAPSTTASEFYAEQAAICGRESHQASQRKTRYATFAAFGAALTASGFVTLVRIPPVLYHDLGAVAFELIGSGLSIVGATIAVFGMVEAFRAASEETSLYALARRCEIEGAAAEIGENGHPPIQSKDAPKPA
ncbi:MAG TPA: hypothetical protein VMV79_07330 [Alphaproteobacteria bacterium]|nr:hypothetical protein [Alphaproteobacteria bacterium]